MYDPHYSEYIPVWALQLGETLGKTERQAIKSWLDVNSGFNVNYYAVHRDEKG